MIRLKHFTLAHILEIDAKNHLFPLSPNYHTTIVITLNLVRNSTKLQDNVFLLYNHFIKNSDDFNKVVIHILYKRIHLIHNYI